MEEKIQIIKNDKAKNFEIFYDYFTFEGNEDMQLQHLIIDFEIPDKILSKENQQKIFNKFIEIDKEFRRKNLSLESFPYLTNSIFVEIEKLHESLKDENEKNYLLCLLINNYFGFRQNLESFYINHITENDFGLSNAITKSFINKVDKSANFTELIKELAKWYIKSEFIIFDLKLLDLFKGVKLPFENESLTLEKNYNFSLKTFTKKNFLKLTSYLVTKLSGLVNFGSIDYQKLGLLLLSSLTCGLRLSSFFAIDIGLIAFAVILNLNSGRRNLKLCFRKD